MPIIENTRTSRITGPDSIPHPDRSKVSKENPDPRLPFPGGPVIIQPAELRGEGRETKIIPAPTELSDERFEHAMRDSSFRKLFKHEVLFVLDPNGQRIRFREDGEIKAPTATVVQSLDSVTEAQARELLKRFPHLAAPPVAQTGDATPPAGNQPPAPEPQPQQPQGGSQSGNGNQRPQGNGNPRR
jgi:hypothetical protein